MQEKMDKIHKLHKCLVLHCTTINVTGSAKTLQVRVFYTSLQKQL